MGRRRKLIRKKTAGSDSIILLIAGILTLAGAVIFGIFKLIGTLFNAGTKSVANAKINEATRKIEGDPDLLKAGQLVSQVQSLATFSDVIGWDREASELVALLLKRESDSTASSLADQLQEYIDLTPESKSERKELLSELRREKKDLQLQKREINANMKDIRTVARQKSASAPYTLRGMMGMTALQRQQLRYEKEQSLAPLEGRKDWIDSQINQVDRKIVWAQRFTEEAAQQTDGMEAEPPGLIGDSY